MKLVVLIACFLQITLGKAQEGIIFLKEPLNWRYEKIDFPLDFAPEISYKGFEELRFSPGMFDVTSEEYFTYAFVIALEKEDEFSIKEMETFLTIYFKGLCNAVMNSKKMTIDLDKITVETQKINQQFISKIHFFDPFTDGRIVDLKMEMDVVKKNDKTILITLVSPQEKEHKIWNILYNIKKSIKL